jgi:translation initiation factor 3 subunit F
VEKIEIKAYLCETLGSFGEVARIGTAFMPIPYECKSADEEAFEMSLLHKAAVKGDEAPITTELEALETTLYELQELVSKALEYVESVLSGNIAGSVDVGVKLMEALSSVPHIDGDNFEKLFQSQLKDILIVLYLANLTKTQLAIAEKLHQVQ